MTGVRLRPTSYLVLTLALVAPAQGQTDGGHDRKWLSCDVNWLVSDQSTGPNFTVKVTDRQVPVPSVRVSLEKRLSDLGSNNTALAALSETNSQGIAEFSNVPPGEYFARVEAGHLSISSNEIEVGNQSMESSQIKLEWPPTSIATQNIRGRMQISMPSSKASRPLAYALVQLWDFHEVKLLASVHTDAAGNYEFPSVDPGVYVVRFSVGSDHTPNSAGMKVEVDYGAAKQEIPGMKFVDDECNRRLVPLTPIPTTNN